MSESSGEAIAVLTGAILVGLFLYTRRMRGRKVFGDLGKRRAKPEKGPIQRKLAEFADEEPQEAIEPTLPAESAAPLVDETRQDVAMQPLEPESPESVAETGVLKQAHDFFEMGSDKKAANMLYDAAIMDVATTREVTIASHATHWEKYHTLEAVMPERQEPSLKLTTLYELANYSGRALTEEQQNAALDAFRAINAHLESANTYGLLCWRYHTIFVSSHSSLTNR